MSRFYKYPRHVPSLCLKPLRYWLLVWVMLSFVKLPAQSLDRMVEQALSQGPLTISHVDSSEVISLLEPHSKIRLKQEQFYGWYAAGKIKYTQGGYSGKLLHGPYTLYSRGKELLAEGLYSKGLRTGVWRTWYPNGYLLSVHHYRKGLKHGTYQLLYENGNLKQAGSYKRGKLHGNIYQYSPEGEPQRSRYRQGKLTTGKVKSRAKKARAAKQSSVENTSGKAKKRAHNKSEDERKVSPKRSKSVNKKAKELSNGQ